MFYQNVTHSVRISLKIEIGRFVGICRWQIRLFCPSHLNKRECCKCDKNGLVATSTALGQPNGTILPPPPQNEVLNLTNLQNFPNLLGCG
jgi:hypothetical protein